MHTDPTCVQYCGKQLPYMFYRGNPFCIEDAKDRNGWFIVDYAIGGYANDQTITADCSD